MLTNMRNSIVLVLLAARFVLAAINIDGSQALWASENDASPIGVLDTYIPDQHGTLLSIPMLSKVMSKEKS
jgi:hypothetical protein